MRSFTAYLPVFVFIWFVMIVIASSLSLFSQDSDTSGNEPIIITGSSGLADAVSDAANEWQKMTPIEVRVDVSDSSTALRDLERKGADVAMISRYLTLPEMTDYPDLTFTPIGYDAVAVVVSPSNNILSLSEDQVRDIFTGKVRDWGSVGWRSDQPIQVLGREPGSQERDFFRKSALKTSLFRKDIGVFRSDEEIIRSLRNDQNGTMIAYLPVSKVPPDLRIVSISNSAEKSVLPSDEAIANGDYPYVRSLGLVTRSGSRSDVQALVTFIASPYGREILLKKGVIPLQSSQKQNDEPGTYEDWKKHGYRIH